jgi:hypothetical protein
MNQVFGRVIAKCKHVLCLCGSAWRLCWDVGYQTPLCCGTSKCSSASSWCSPYLGSCSQAVSELCKISVSPDLAAQHLYICFQGRMCSRHCCYPAYGQFLDSGACALTQLHAPKLTTLFVTHLQLANTHTLEFIPEIPRLIALVATLSERLDSCFGAFSIISLSLSVSLCVSLSLSLCLSQTLSLSFILFLSRHALLGNSLMPAQI